MAPGWSKGKALGMGGAGSLRLRPRPRPRPGTCWRAGGQAEPAAGGAQVVGRAQVTPSHQASQAWDLPVLRHTVSRAVLLKSRARHVGISSSRRINASVVVHGPPTSKTLPPCAIHSPIAPPAPPYPGAGLQAFALSVPSVWNALLLGVGMGPPSRSFS